MRFKKCAFLTKKYFDGRQKTMLSFPGKLPRIFGKSWKTKVTHFNEKLSTSLKEAVNSSLSQENQQPS